MAKKYAAHDRSMPAAFEESFHTPGMLPVSAIMVSVADAETGIPNILPAVGWGWLCRLPLLLGVSVCTEDLNADYYPRGSHPLLIKTGDFALNIPTLDLTDQISKCGELSRHKDPRVDKFKEAHLTPGPGINITSPHILECPINYECKVSSVHSLGSHDLVIGEVVGCFTDGEVFAVETNKGEDAIGMKCDDGSIVNVFWKTLPIRTVTDKS
jgi:flavin reductase (DIM6/NTAB) family NADH-FMN oxidoreductase RutF